MAGLGVDGRAWGRLFGPIVQGFDDLIEDVFRPIVHVAHHPLKLVYFGLNALLPATWTAKRFSTDEARALFGGVAAHGWPVAEGGSRSITEAMARRLASLGGTIETGVHELDLAVQDGIPWSNEHVRRAGTVHLGGRFGETVAAERAVTQGRTPGEPFVLVGQRYLADPHPVGRRAASGLGLCPRASRFDG